MKKKIFFLGMTVLILSLGLVFVGCKDDSDDSGGNNGGGGGLVPAELRGNWLRDSAGSERYLTFTSSGYGTNSNSFANVRADIVITAVLAANKLEFQMTGFTSKGSFEYSIAGDKLTISNLTGTGSGGMIANSPYTKQP